MHLFHISKIYAMFWCQILLIQFHSCNSESEFLQFRPPAFGGEEATGTEPWLSYWCGFEEFHTCVYQNVLFDTPSSKRTCPYSLFHLPVSFSHHTYPTCFCLFSWVWIKTTTVRRRQPAFSLSSVWQGGCHIVNVYWQSPWESEGLHLL